MMQRFMTRFSLALGGCLVFITTSLAATIITTTSPMAFICASFLDQNNGITSSLTCRLACSAAVWSPNIFNVYVNCGEVTPISTAYPYGSITSSEACWKSGYGCCPQTMPRPIQFLDLNATETFWACTSFIEAAITMLGSFNVAASVMYMEATTTTVTVESVTRTTPSITTQATPTATLTQSTSVSSTFTSTPASTATKSTMIPSTPTEKPPPSTVILELPNTTLLIGSSASSAVPVQMSRGGVTAIVLCASVALLLLLTMAYWNHIKRCFGRKDVNELPRRRVPRPPPRNTTFSLGRSAGQGRFTGDHGWPSGNIFELEGDIPRTPKKPLAAKVRPMSTIAEERGSKIGK